MIFVSLPPAHSHCNIDDVISPGRSETVNNYLEFNVLMNPMGQENVQRAWQRLKIP
jgi:hypothetical protein